VWNLQERLDEAHDQLTERLNLNSQETLEILDLRRRVREALTQVESLSMQLSYEREGNRFCQVCTDHSEGELDHSAALAAARAEGGKKALLEAAEYLDSCLNSYSSGWLRQRAAALGES
jgi:small-conductance mechanosensitive channel